MKNFVFAAVLFFAGAVSQSHATSCFTGTPFPQSTFNLLVDILGRDSVDDGTVECFSNMFDGATTRELVGNREGIDLMRRIMLPFYETAEIVRMERHRHPRGGRHRQINIYVGDSTHPELGAQTVIEDHCWGTGRGGRHCRIMNIRRLE